MTDKRVCGVCTAKGHTSRECPRLSNTTIILHPRDVAAFKEAFPDAVEIKDSVTKSSDGLSGLENVTHGGKRIGSGRKPSHTSSAARQKAYRERNRGN